MVVITRPVKPKTAFTYFRIVAGLIAFVLAIILLRNSKQSHDPPLSTNSAEVPTQVGMRSPTSRKVDEGLEGRLFSFALENLKGGGSGLIKIRSRPSWSPVGVERFHALVDSGFFDGNRFFRVVPNQIVQFGINGDPQVQRIWRGRVIPDEPLVQKNRRGTLSFASSGQNSRETQVFIYTHIEGNKLLDDKGFVPFAEVVEGMEFVDQINDEYEESPSVGRTDRFGDFYLKDFPNLSYISSAWGH